MSCCWPLPWPSHWVPSRGRVLLTAWQRLELCTGSPKVRCHGQEGTLARSKQWHPFNCCSCVVHLLTPHEDRDSVCSWSSCSINGCAETASTLIKPHLPFCCSAPGVWLSALWFLGSASYKWGNLLFFINNMTFWDLTWWFLHSIPAVCWGCWAQTGSRFSVLLMVRSGSGHSTAPLIWTTDLHEYTQQHGKASARRRRPDRDDLRWREYIWPLLKVTLSCRSSSRRTKTIWGAEFNPTDKCSVGGCKRSEIQKTFKRGLSNTPIHLAQKTALKSRTSFLTKGLDAQDLRLRTIAGWELNTTSSIMPLIMSRSVSAP